MPRGLHHLVHVVRDLDAAGEVYDLIGFTVGPRNHHPWGTHNRIIQTAGFYLELLEVAEPEKIQEAAGSHFSFGAYNRDFLARCGEGFSMLALEGSDPAAEKAAFDAAGFGGFDLFDFSRMARSPDGQEKEVGFSLTFAMDPAAPDAAFCTCTQRKPENFWAPNMQRHANGTEGVAGVVLVAAHPADHLAFIDTLAGVTPQRVTDTWYVAKTPRGGIDVMTRATFTERFGVPAPSGEGLRIAGVRFSSPGAADMRRGLVARGMLEEKIEGLVVISPKSAMGATIVLDRPS